MSPTGVITTFAGGGGIIDDGYPATQAALAPTAMAMDSTGNLFIADTVYGLSRIRKVATNGVITTVAGGSSCCGLGDGGAATSAYIAVPYGLAVGGGNVYIAQVDRNNNLIRRVSANGNISTIAGGGSNAGDGGLATSASLSGPLGVAVDSAGNVYIAETKANRIRKVGTNGIITTVAGNGSATDSGDGGLAVQAGVSSPRHVTVDAAGDLFIAQMSDARVRMVTSGGMIYTIAGNGAHGFSGDGGPAMSAMLDLPAGIAIGSQGKLYVADTSSPIARVRLLTPVIPPILSITSTHTGSFSQGQTGATYTVTVSNTASGGSTVGAVTVTDTLPSGLIATAIAGSGWTCTLVSVSCTRSDGLNGGANYSAITVTVNVAVNASSPQVNSVSVTGGGATTAGNTDSTVIAPGQAPPAVTVFSPGQGATGIPTNASLTWGAVTGATSYDVSFGTSTSPPVVTNTTGTSYSPTMNTGTLYYWLVTAKNAFGSTPSVLWFFTTGSQITGFQFVPVTPCRVMDTRGATGTFGGPSIAAGATRSVPIPSSSCGIPSSAQAYSLNITVVPPGPLTYLSIWPTGQAQPVVSTVNSLDGRIVANAAIVPAGTNGAISLFVSNTTDVIIDINGYFAPASTTGSMSFYTATPCRIADTRNGTGAFGGPFMSGGSTRSFVVPSSSCGIPAAAQAYSLNITVVPHGTLGYLSTWPTGQSQPVVSTLNSLDGSIAANAAIVPAGTGGAISVFVTNDTDLIIDINGYFAPAGSAGALSLYTLTPCRVADTRGATGAFGGPSLAANATRSFAIPSSACNVPSTAQAYSLNVTVVPPGPLVYLTAWPTGQTQPVVSTLNSPGGKVVANAAIVPAGATGPGGVSIFVSNATDVILDINAYFAQ